MTDSFNMPRAKRTEIINEIAEELRKLKLIGDRKWHSIEYASENLITARNFLRSITKDAETKEDGK